MRYTIKLIILILVGATVAHLLASLEGTTHIDWPGWRLSAPTGLVVAAVLLLVWLVLAFDRIFGFIANIPYRISGGWMSRRGQRGQRALALGMAAAAAGDGREAMKHARKSVHYLGHDVMTDLLMAQASALSGDDKSAMRYFEALKNHPDTAYFGHVGLMRLAASAGDDAAALAAGRAAVALKPASPGIAHAVFVLEAREGEWATAATALKHARRSGSIGEDEAAEIEAALALELARNETRDRVAEAHLARALKAEPDFIPAALALADRYIAAGRTRKATGILEKSFLVAPHRETADRLMQCWPDNEAAALGRLVKLTEKGGNKAEALLITATKAFEQSLWVEAERLASLIPEKERDSRVWWLFADLAEHRPEKEYAGKHDRDWPQKDASLRQAALAPRPRAWTCGNCGSHYEHWQSVCDQCESFARIRWR